MGVLLKIILISFLVYYTVKVALRLFLPFWGRKFEEELYRRTQNNQNIKNEGEITIQYRNEKSKKIDKDIGEYTDFEEIE